MVWASRKLSSRICDQVAWIGTYDEDFDAQVERDMQADFCTNSDRYHYCSDEDCTDTMFEFKDHSCERVPYFEAFLKTQSSEGYLFYVPSFFKELNLETRRYHGPSDCTTGCASLGLASTPAPHHTTGERG